MNWLWLCKLKHNWEYHDGEVEQVEPLSIYCFVRYVRVCKRCEKIQEFNTIIPQIAPFLFGIPWSDIKVKQNAL